MKEPNINWTKEELKAYILIYSASADLTESKEEIKIIKSKVSLSTFEKMQAEFDKDNDNQTLQKILKSFKDLDYTNAEIDGVYDEINALFLADDNFDIMEQNLGLGLKRLFGMIKADNEKED